MKKAQVFAAYNLIRAKFLGRRIPLVVGWSITNRCNWRCEYCIRGTHESEELTTKQIFSLIDQLADMGTYSINLTGGEPLIREDIGRIVDYAKNKGIHVGISSNGALISEEIQNIRNVDSLTLSYDGPQEIHDKQRQRGTYPLVVDAVKTAKEFSISVKFHTVLTINNVDYIDSILDFSRRFNVVVNFAIIEFAPFSNKKNIKALLPPIEKYKSAIRSLIVKKRRGDESIGNSLNGLKYLYQWPNYRKINCCAAKIYCRIEPNGDIFPCGNLVRSSKPLNCIDQGFKGAFMNLRLDGCRSCWCDTRIELNYVYSLNLKSILNTKKVYKL